MSLLYLIETGRKQNNKNNLGFVSKRIPTCTFLSKHTLFYQKKFSWRCNTEI